MEILDSLICHQERERASFHMPGHKNGAAFAGTRFESSLLALDVTEVAGTDCLAHPEEAIFASQQKAARLYSAEKAFYLVNGATCGILSMFYALFREGDSVLIDRGCHRSAINALAICGINPIYIAPDLDPVRGIPKGFTADKIRAELRKHPEAKGVFITSPNYYGMVSELCEIARATHETGALLLVDEAHGAHFPFDERLPEGAVQQGADASVVSLHKSLPCPNQTALLLLREETYAEELQNAVNTFQTTSPSYVLLVYIEIALELARERGKDLTDTLLKRLAPFAKYQTDDPFKLLLSFTQNGLSGYDAEKILRKEYGIYAELCDQKNVLLMASWANPAEDFALLDKALQRLKSACGKSLADSASNISFPEGRPILTPRAVRAAKKEWIPLQEASGRICARSVTAFPPCIPVILPGEQITPEQMESVHHLMEHQSIDGISDQKICVVK